jgi:hypothetical protein
MTLIDVEFSHALVAFFLLGTNVLFSALLSNIIYDNSLGGKIMFTLVKIYEKNYRSTNTPAARTEPLISLSPLERVIHLTIGHVHFFIHEFTVYHILITLEKYGH